MHHIIYKTTCLTTGKWYIGMHSSNYEDDRYMGSGKILTSSIRKHGRENHRRETLITARSRDELRDLERAMVTEELLQNPMCMNLAPGGSGSGFGRKITQATKDKMAVSAAVRWARGVPDDHREAARARRGVKNGRSKTWSLQAPNGKLHLTSACGDFCKQLGISYYGLRNKAVTNDTTPVARGPSKGWSVLSCTEKI
jgi:hypothetical protein